ncbi:MAG: hypothetical protein HY321_11765 [Armatimonadetes bacterium]|nr:hypothetical protein [Armatimonadota bacterium]
MRVSRERLDPSTLAVAARLEDQYRGVPLVALGQTVLWDEPTKAALFGVLSALHPGQRRILLGINDHDYFSKTAAPLPTDEPFALVEHNDGTTRDLWVATGEVSMLFGSETIPTRDLLHQHGVELEKAARGALEGREDFIDRVTTAWGWRGIAQTGHGRQIAHEIRLSPVLPYLCDILRWGLCESAALLHEPRHQEAAADFADEVICWVRSFARDHPGALLSDAYRAMHLRFCRRLTGSEPDGVETFTSTDAFRFHTGSVGRARFRLLDLFLNPETREILRDAYDHAVQGTQTYTLDRFGEGAIPFDLVVPGRGRGTMRILPDGVAVATPDPVWIPAGRRVESAAELAAVTERALGPDVALVGKGYVFVCMVTSEAILVFHEGGSSYVARTARMLQAVAERGIRVPLYPILRIRHHTWDALSGTETCFQLPEHLADAFDTPHICGAELARRWRGVVAEKKHLLEEVAGLGGARDLLAFLARRGNDDWLERLEAYTRAHDLLLEIRDRSQAFEARSQALFEESNRLKEEVQRIETAKGENYRQRIKPLRERLWDLARQGVDAGPEVEDLQRRTAEEEAPRVAFDRALRERRERIRALDQEAKAVRKARMQNEKGPEAAEARRAIAGIEREAERALLELVRRALLVSRGLPQSNLRPSAWWFPLVDPTGRWFEDLAHRMEVYFEPLSPCEP